MSQLKLPPSSAGLSHGYQVFMLVLCIYSLAIIAFQASGPAPATMVILDYSDFAVCILFFADFVISLVRAENKWRYLVTWGWLDLLSSIPAIDLARWGRAARILRIFRLLRGFRAAHMLTTLVLVNRARNTVMAACLTAIILITVCSIAVLHFETAPDSNIRTAEDALWWAFATITTVGYGDRYPTTTEGRIVAVLLMVGGVGLFGTFTGLLASWFRGEGEESANAELVAVKNELAMMRMALENRES